MMKPDSDLCLRVATYLATVKGVGPLEDPFAADDPDLTRGAPQGQKFVDLIAPTADDGRFAIEHTKIESYAGQLTDAEQMERLLEPLEHDLAGLLPTDRTYRLAAGLGAVADKMLEPDLVRAALTPWIIEKAQTLIAGSPASAPRHQVIGTLDELPVEVTLSAWPPGDRGGALLVLRSLPSDADQMMDLRVARMSKALRTKLPKLLDQAPARTVLVLEDPDMATSNISEVWIALRRAAQGLQLCDTIFVVETWLQEPSAVVVYDDGTWLEDFNQHRFPLPPAA